MKGNVEQQVAAIEEFKTALMTWRKTGDDKVRAWLNQNMHAIRRITIEAKTFSHVVIAAPPILRQPPISVDPFAMMFEAIYNMSLIPSLIDMLDKTIGVLRNPPPPEEMGDDPLIETEVERGYAFIAMPTDEGDDQLVDVLETIKVRGEGVRHRCRAHRRRPEQRAHYWSHAGKCLQSRVPDR